jgi:CRP-like cAMP-binding protein
MTTSPNKILNALPAAEYKHVAAKLQSVALNLGDILYQPEDEIQNVYFVNTGVISLLAMLESGATVEAGVIGSEGMLGIPVVLGVRTTPNQGLVQSKGEAMMMKAADLRAEFRNGGMLRDLLLRFTHSLFTQVAQTAACNRLHTVDHRLARWLLMTHDRVEGDSFALTQDFLSRMLGVRRAGVSVSAGTLKQAGLIDYGRGSVRIINREGLEKASCECYRMVKEEYENHLDF